MGTSNSRRRLRQKRPDRCTTTGRSKNRDEDCDTTHTTHTTHDTHAHLRPHTQSSVVEAGGTLEAEAGSSRVVEDVQVTQERGVRDALRAIVARPEVDVDREVVLPLQHA
jgi:hypothetical protein